MANKSIFKVAILAVLITPSLAFATPNYLDEMAMMDAQISYLQKKGELDRLKGTGGESLPKIKSIITDSNGASAKLIYASGNERWVHSGSEVQDGLEVLFIGRYSVVVGAKNSKNKIKLDFYTPPDANTFGLPAGMPMPGGASGYVPPMMVPAPFLPPVQPTQPTQATPQ